MKCFTVTETAEWGIPIHNTSLMECDPALVLGDPGSRSLVPLGRELRCVFRDAMEEGLTDLRLLRAEMSTQGTLRFVKERNPKDYRGLIYMATECGPGGGLRLLANSYREELTRGRIRRVYDPFPPLGVEVLAGGVSSNGAPQGLLVMHPGSSFRVERGGELEGASPILIMTWSGSLLRCFPPKKYRETEAAA